MGAGVPAPFRAAGLPGRDDLAIGRSSCDILGSGVQPRGRPEGSGRGLELTRFHRHIPGSKGIPPIPPLVSVTANTLSRHFFLGYRKRPLTVVIVSEAVQSVPRRLHVDRSPAPSQRTKRWPLVVTSFSGYPSRLPTAT